MPIERRTTALYCRLSKDDDMLGESVSVKTQKLILEKYAVEHGYYKYEFYVDDGYSGTDFNRPDFKRMIRDIENGMVERVIVKDLSRLGRNYILIGEYVEFLFPKYDVHFISVTENMDSAVGNLEMMPFNNLINEWYARDLSKKQRSAVRTKGTNGKRLTSKAIYGYTTDDNSNWVIDETSAEVVKKIFDMYVNGNGLQMIARYLTQNKIPTPSTYQSSQEAFNWGYSTIRNILSKQEYCGDTVNFRTERVSYKSKKIKRNRTEDWVIFPDTHPAIVSREIFAKAQEIAGAKKRIISKNAEYDKPLFRDVLFCADCGRRMYIMHKNGKHVNSDSYVCNTNRKNKDLCSSHYIREIEIIGLVMNDIQYYIRYLMMDENTLRNNLVRMVKLRNSAVLSEATGRLKSIDSRINEIPDVRKRLFEDKLSGDISGGTFADIMASLDSETEKLKSERDCVMRVIRESKDSINDVEIFINRLKRYKNTAELSSSMVEDLIERIDVLNPETVSKRVKHQKIVITYVGVGKIEDDL